MLADYLDLARFAEDTGLLNSQTVDRLFARSQADPARAQKVLNGRENCAKRFTMSFRAIIDKRPVPHMALTRLNGSVQNAAEQHAAGFGKGRLRMEL